MDECPWRLLEECPIVSSFSMCHAPSSFYFLVSSFVSSSFEKLSRCPTGDVALPRIKCSYPGLIRMVNLFFFPLWRPVPDVLSPDIWLKWYQENGQGTSLRSTTTVLKITIWKTHDLASGDCVTTQTRTFTHIWFESFQNSAGSLSLHQRVIRGKIRNPRPCSIDEWAVTTGWADFITQPTNVHQHFIFTNCISNADKMETLCIFILLLSDTQTWDMCMNNVCKLSSISEFFLSTLHNEGIIIIIIIIICIPPEENVNYGQILKGK